MNIRSSSFHVLPRDSSGDGDLLPSPTDYKSLAGGSHRRRRRNKTKKNNLSQPTVELGLGSGLLEGGPFDDRARSAVSTPGGFMDPDDHHDHRHFGQESFLGSQQWERMPSVSNSHVSTVLTACTSQFSNGSLPPPSHSVEELFNGTNLAHSGMSEADLNGQMQSSITACNPDSTADGVLAYIYVKKEKMSHQQSMEKRHARDKSYYPDSSVLIQALVKKDKECDQLSIVERQQGQNGSVDSVPAESRVHDGTDHSSLAVSKTQTSLSCSADDGQVFNTFRSTNEDVVSPGVISEVEVFVDDGWSSQFSRAELRQRTTHNLVKDSLQCESDHAVEAPLQSKEHQAASTTAASECSIRDVNRDSHGGGYYYQTPDKLTHVPVMHVETPGLLDWEQLMSANSLCSQPAIASPLEYFIGEVLRSPPTLQETQSAETDKKRQHVYNTMFHVPWRCELLIIVGFFVCLDSFLSLLTVMPVRIIIFLWRFFAKGRQFRRLRADELSDLGSLLVLVGGVTLLQQTDISYIYHMIRSQATIKLYVVYNVLEIFDKLCQSFGSDVLQVLLNSAENVATCPSVALLSETFRFMLDQCIAVVSFVVHSFIILAQSITVSAAIRSHNNALLTLLISNNFAEIKSNVFKRLAKDNLHKLAYLDTVERFHIIAHLFFVLAQNLLAANEPWLSAFACNAGMVFLCEILVDVIKHAFLAKFNEIKPAAYSEFLQALCKQTLNSQSHEVHKTMSFVPFAPACVVIRVLIPLYAAYLPGAFLWRLLCMLIYGIMTYLFLVTLKISVALGLSKHASWYIARYGKKEKLLHFD